MALTKKRTLYISTALLLAAAIYFYPFLYSSIEWSRNSRFRYEGRTPVKLPFRWISDEGGGLSLRKPTVTITSYVFRDTRLTIDDHGSNLKPNAEGRARVLHNFNIIDSNYIPNDPANPFRSAGLLCSPDGKTPLGVKNPLGMLMIFCLSRDFRYSLIFTGSKENIQQASDIAKQIIH